MAVIMAKGLNAFAQVQVIRVSAPLIPMRFGRRRRSWLLCLNYRPIQTILLATVKVPIAEALAALGVVNRTDATMKAGDIGLI